MTDNLDTNLPDDEDGIEIEDEIREFDPLNVDKPTRDPRGKARIEHAIPKRRRAGRPRKGEEAIKGGYQTVWAPQKRADGSPGPQYALLACPFSEIFFGGARGGGKSLTLDELIVTPTGYRRMGEMSIGDEVHGPGGTVVRVIGVYPQGVEDVFRITLVDGRTVRASRGHLWRVRVGPDEMTVTTDSVRKFLLARMEVSLPVETLECWVAIASIEYVGLAETQCIKIDSDDGLFLTNDEIVTHNTDGAIGVWLEHAARYGANAKGLFLRRQYANLKDVLDRMNTLFPKIGATFNKGEGVWLFPNGANLKLGHLWDETATNAYQGHQYCVAAGTPVLMGDGTYRPIEDVLVGDEVMTLEGPKEVLGTMPPRMSPCVRVQVFDETGEKVGEQIHPEDHPVLTSVSLLPSDQHGTSRSFSPLQQFRTVGSAKEPHPFVHQGFASPDTQRYPERPNDPGLCRSLAGSSEIPHRQMEFPAPWQSYTTLLDAHLRTQGNDVFGEGDQTGYTSFADSLREAEPLLQLSVPVVLHGHHHPLGQLNLHASKRIHDPYKSAELPSMTVQGTTLEHAGQEQRAELFLCSLGYSNPHLSYDASCVRLATKTVQDCLDDCSSYHHPGDGRPHPSSGTDEVCVPSPADVEEHILMDEREGDWGRIQKYTHPHLSSYTHPYTGQDRMVHQPYRFGHAVFQPCEPHVVHDLTVADANHYITDSNLVNKNSLIAVEEITQYPTPMPIDMMRATLRSAAGVPTKLIMTGNPGGAGHSWVRERYVSPAPAGFTPIADPKTGKTRIYIPSRVTDNLLLMQNDPNYIANLKQSGSDILVKAWLEGDWNIVAGGFFSDILNPEKHFIRPFEIPDTWRYRRSFDWGSAAPAALCIWAVSDGNPVPDLDGFVFPRGSLILVKEWYTVAMKDDGTLQPNQGQRLTNLALGNGVGQRSLKYNFSGCVADPSIFAKPGRESIFDETNEGAAEVGHNLILSPADNNRVAGWQRMRDMLENATKDIPEKPGLWIFNTCKHWIRTVPVLQRDETKPDDLDTSQEDHCLAGTTLVETDRGHVAIRDLVGTSGNVRQDDASWRRYSDCRRTRIAAPTIRVVTSDGRSVVCTPDHLILTDNGWVEAKDTVGMTLACVDTGCQVVRIETAGDQDVYNLEVEDTHAFAVNGGLIVHNCADATRYAVQTGVRSMVIGDLSGR